MDGQPKTLTSDNFDRWKHRWERRCLPYARLRVRTPFSEVEIKERISERTVTPKWHKRLLRTGGTDEMRFLGKIEGSDFTLEPRHTTYKMLLIAVGKGKIEPTDGGVINVEMFVRPHLGMLVAFLLLYGLTLFVPAVIFLMTGWTLPFLIYLPGVVFSLLLMSLYKLQVGMFFRDASVIPIFLSTMGDVRFEE